MIIFENVDKHNIIALQALLSQNMNTNGGIALAASLGRREMVEMMLEHGCDATGAYRAAADNHRDEILTRMDAHDREVCCECILI